MAKKKLTDSQVIDLLMLFDVNGFSPAELATHFNISVSTVSRILKKSGRVVRAREAHRVLISNKVKSKLIRILSGYGVNRPDLLISDLDKNFLIELREEEDFEIIYV